jgi:ankyrin repeat protein
MSEKPRSTKKEKIVEEVAEQEPVEVKKKKVSKDVVEEPVETEAASSDAPKKRKKKPAAESVEEEGGAPQQTTDSPKSARGHVKNESMMTMINTTLSVEDMEEMAVKSARTPRGIGQESPRAVEPVVDSAKANKAHLATTQTDVERKKIEPFPRLYVNVTEVKGAKPGNYFVTVSFGNSKEAAWTSDITKKSTTWENKGRLIPIPAGSTHVTVTMHSKGMIGDMLNKIKGEAVWDLTALSDGYPHQPWAPMLKKSATKAQLRVQLMYLPENIDLDGDEFITPLHALIRKGKLDLLTRAVDDIFADLRLTDADGRTPLHLAVELNRPKFVKLLLKSLKGEGNTLYTPKKESALHFAGKYASGNIAKQLLAAGFDPNAPADLKRTPLHFAAHADNVEVVEALVEAEGISINAQDKAGNTALVEALSSDATKTVTALVNAGADIYIQNDKDLTVWEVAQRKDMVNTEARKSFMNAIGVHDAREFPVRQKFPKKTVVKAKDCSLDYEESQQFAISVSEAHEVCIILTTDDVIASPAFAGSSGFAVIKSDQGVHNELAISRDTVAFSGNRAVTLKMEPNFFYVVVPYAKTQDAVRDFSLVILAPKKKNVTVAPLKKWAHIAEVESKWEGKSAGGAQPAPTWTDNPQFELTMPQEDDVQFAVLLTQEENDPELRYVDGDDHKKIPYDHPVGFYLCDRGGVKVLEQVEKWTNSRDVHQQFQMDFSQRNHICIIPTMHQAGTESPFTLRVFCDKPITLAPK